jgi:spermidine synthase
MIVRKILSYIVPFTIRKIRSAFSGALELTIINGKKVLDSAHANYSFGTLQRVLKFGLTKVNLSCIRNILLLEVA